MDDTAQPDRGTGGTVELCSGMDGMVTPGRGTDVTTENGSAAGLSRGTDDTVELGIGIDNEAALGSRTAEAE